MEFQISVQKWRRERYKGWERDEREKGTKDGEGGGGRGGIGGDKVDGATPELMKMKVEESDRGGGSNLI